MKGKRRREDRAGRRREAGEKRREAARQREGTGLGAPRAMSLLATALAALLATALAPGKRHHGREAAGAQPGQHLPAGTGQPPRPPSGPRAPPPAPSRRGAGSGSFPRRRRRGMGWAAAPSRGSARGSDTRRGGLARSSGEGRCLPGEPGSTARNGYSRRPPPRGRSLTQLCHRLSRLLQSYLTHNCAFTKKTNKQRNPTKTNRKTFPCRSLQKYFLCCLLREAGKY